MKIKEAKEIVGTILEWQFVLMGLKSANDIKANHDLSKYSLCDLIKANQLIESNNNRKKKLCEYWKKKTGKSYSCTVSMILADRLIAAVYTLLNFEPNGELIAIINNLGVGCVTVTNDN